MTITGGNLVLGNATFGNSNFTNIFTYSIDDVRFHPIHIDDVPDSITIEFDIINGDTFQLESSRSFVFPTDATTGTIILSASQRTTNFSVTNDIVPSSIIVNWKVRRTNEVSSFVNESQTVPFDGVQPPDNFDIVLTAENGQELTGTATSLDKDFIQVQLTEFGAQMVFSPSTATANLTAERMLQFITDNQIEAPIINSIKFRVIAENLNETSGRVPPSEADTVIQGLPQFNAIETHVNKIELPNTTASALLNFAESNQISIQPESMDSTVTAQNGATQLVVVTVADFNILQGSLLQWSATITGFLVERTPTHSIADVESFAQLNQTDPPIDEKYFKITGDGISTDITSYDIHVEGTIRHGDKAEVGDIITSFGAHGYVGGGKFDDWWIRGTLTKVVITGFGATATLDGVNFPVEVSEIHNYLVTVTAQNGATIGGVLSDLDWQVLKAGLSALNATLTEERVTLDITSTSTILLQFAEDNQEIIDTSIEDTSVSILPSNFELIDGRLKGEITYIANANFNPLYFGSEFHVGALVQYTGEDNINRFVEQTLNFTETERDEHQTINEDAFGNKVIGVTFFVVSALNTPFAKSFGLTVSDGFDPCPVGFHQENGVCVPDNKPTGKVVEIIKGAFFGTLAIALLGSRGR